MKVSWHAWVLVVASCQAIAQGVEDTVEGAPPQVWISAGGFSRHFSRSSGYNENNRGLGVEYRTAPAVSYMVGAFDNSVRRTTRYAAMNWQPLAWGPVRLGAAIGFMDGYPGISHGHTFFAALPLASWEGRRWGVNVGLIPSLGRIEGSWIVQFKARVY